MQRNIEKTKPMAFVTMPLGFVKYILGCRTKNLLEWHDRYIAYYSGQNHDPQAHAAFNIAEKEARPLDFPLMREIVNKTCSAHLCIPIKEGHTAYVFKETDGELVWNVPRDATAANEDAYQSFSQMAVAHRQYPNHIAEVVEAVAVRRDELSKPICVWGVKYIDGKEITQHPQTGRLGVIEKFNGTAPPDITWLPDDASERILTLISEIENATGISVDLYHGDVVLRKDGTPCIVACTGNKELHLNIQAAAGTPNFRRLRLPNEIAAPQPAQSNGRRQVSYDEIGRVHNLLHQMGLKLVMTKGKEYALAENDALAHFYRQAEKAGITPIQVAANHLTKQVDAILSFVRQEVELSEEQILNRVVDARNYLVFMAILACLEKINRKDVKSGN